MLVVVCALAEVDSLVAVVCWFEAARQCTDIPINIAKVIPLSRVGEDGIFFMVSPPVLAFL